MDLPLALKNNTESEMDRRQGRQEEAHPDSKEEERKIN